MLNPLRVVIVSFRIPMKEREREREKKDKVIVQMFLVFTRKFVRVCEDDDPEDCVEMIDCDEH